MLYGSNLTCNILRFHLQRFKVKAKEGIFNKIKAEDIIDFGICKVEVFTTTTSMPNSFGYALHTPDGTIIFSGDYMFDAKGDGAFATDMQHLSDVVTKNKVLLFLTEASSRMAPNHKIKTMLKELLKKHKEELFWLVLTDIPHVKIRTRKRDVLAKRRAECVGG
jgi:ribonuclease J